MSPLRSEKEKHICLATKELSLFSNILRVFKGTVAWDVFSLIASYLGYKDGILKFFHAVLIFTGLGQDLTHLAHKENTHSEIFLLGKLKILILLRLWYKTPSNMAEILTL